MGHSEATNTDKYKKRRNLKTELVIITANQNQPLSYELAIKELQNQGIDINLPEVKAIFRIIYRLKD
ncbi:MULTISPECIES: hypothetical protein [Planktothricoides]|uniref:Uncharacterized protein n=2 Tax=Planktothricoides raciborskii TaxID=132608 RepID=A0AAU8JAQ8_9CYAN|nr:MULTISPECIES: hypothetical protein [Planktothricoides]KOR33813.1 hypothetical protein AM228_27655 [Planktothricoides sp. SR001]MBD2547827.1 hypothetical protein [Planktothricoides raciborskii FACHB-1370]MBD2586265.1 hypothetical protein [Planktothricoides raciborskii FACHB-1261]